MINKAALILIQPFTYAEASIAGIPPGEFITKEERDDFLPHVRAFIEPHGAAAKPKACLIKEEKLVLWDARKKHPVASDLISLTMKEGKLYFFKEGVGVLALRFDFNAIEEELYSQILWALTKLFLNRNPYQVCPRPVGLHQSAAPELLVGQPVADWLISFVAGYAAFKDSFNPLLRSQVMTASLLLVDAGYPLKPAFLEALLLSRKYTTQEGITLLPDSINQVRQSGHIQTFGNTNGVVYLCRDDGSKFSRDNYFDIYGKNYLVTFLIVIFQQIKLQQFIDQTSELMSSDTDTGRVKKMKENILAYIVRTDFTQISHNPSRNLLYKFFRKNLEIRALLDEVSTIIKRIDQDIEGTKSNRKTWISLVVALLVLPTYLFSMIDQILNLPKQWEAVAGSWVLTLAGIIVVCRLEFKKNSSV